MKHYLAGLALIAATVATPAAAAGPGGARRDVTVSVADLDLSTAEGAAILERRLTRAVAKACGTAYFLDGEALRDMDRCRADAGARAERARTRLIARSSGKLAHAREPYPVYPATMTAFR